MPCLAAKVCCPHTRGGEPKGIYKKFWDALLSPHAWG